MPVVVETLKIRVKGSRLKGQRGILRINTEAMRLRVKDPGGYGRARTYDPLVNGQVLFQLSYVPTTKRFLQNLIVSKLRSTF